MRRAIAVAAIIAAAPLSLNAQDASRTVSGGGILAAGWAGQIDAAEAAKNLKLTDSKLMKMGNDFHVTTGPAVAYWNPANKATGNYTVTAKFTEANFMGLNDHPHPYGIVIGGNDLGTETQSYLYCAAYGNGTYILRGFGPAAFQVNGTMPDGTRRRGGEANAAISKAAAKGASVTQEIAVSVKGDEVSCAINGTVVGTYPKSAIVGTGKLKTTDGVYGIRFGHNTEAVVTGFTMKKN